MSSGNPQLDQQSLNSLLTLDEQMRLGRLPNNAAPNLTEAADESFRSGLYALRELEAAIPRDRQTMPSWAPATIGRFRLRSVLGAGGFAVVYLAEDPQLGRQVALKVPRPHALIQPQLRQRFVTEARAAARLDHPHIVQVFEAGEDGDLPYIACSVCHGPTLADWLSKRNSPLHPRITARVVRQLADALQYSHDRGILHRDIKPGNVLLFPQAPAEFEEFPFAAKISDFGLAKLLEDADLDSLTSQLIGTPRFMAPEILREGNRNTSVTADIYALGAVLYTMLTGQAPFGATSLLETMQSIAADDPPAPDLLNRSVSRDLSQICQKCLEKSPAARYASAAQLRDDLDRSLTGQCVLAGQTPLPIRLRKWCRRHPITAAISLVSTLFLLTMAGMTVRYTSSLRQLQGKLQDSNQQLQRQVHELDDALRSASSSQQEASSQRNRVTQLLQIADVNLAGRIWQQGDARGAIQRLEPWLTQTTTDRSLPTPADVALRYLSNQIAVKTIRVTQSDHAVWWMEADSDSGRLLTAGTGEQIELLAAGPATEQDSQTLKSLHTGSGEFNCITLSDDRRLAAASSEDGRVCIWHTNPGDDQMAVSFFRAHELQVLPDAGVYGVRFLPGSHQLISCARTPLLTVWDGDTGSRIRDIETSHPRFIESMVLSADGRMLATAGADGHLEVFRVPEMTSLLRLTASRKPIEMAAFSTDGRLLACGGNDRLLRLYDVNSGSQIASYESLAGIYCVQCNPRDEVLVGDRDGVLTLFRMPLEPAIPAPGDPIPHWRPQKRWAGHQSPVSAICWLGSSSGTEPTGDWFTADRTGFIKSWKLAAARPLVLPRQPQDPDIPVVQPFAGTLLKATDAGIDVIDRETGKLNTSLPVSAVVRSLAVREDIGIVIAGDAEGSLHWFRETAGGLQPADRIPVLPGSPVVRIFTSQDGRLLCAVDSQWKLALVDVPAKTTRMIMENVLLAIPHPDGQHLMRTPKDADDLCVVRLSDGEVVKTLRSHQSTISQIAFTPDGQTCISTSHDRTICIWDATTWALRHQLTGHQRAIRVLAISPRGDLFVTGDESGVLRMWDLASGRELTELDERIPEILGLQFDSDGTTLIAWDHHPRLYVISLWSTQLNM